jgi:hypothetical protein
MDKIVTRSFIYLKLFSKKVSIIKVKKHKLKNKNSYVKVLKKLSQEKEL